MANHTEEVSRVRYLVVEEDAEGQRVDNFLLNRLKGVPRSWVYRVLRRGEVRVNRGRVKPTRRLQLGDEVRIPPVRVSEGSTGKGPGAGLRNRIAQAVLYEDEALLVVDKPSGVAVHGGSGVSFGVIEVLRALRPDAPYLELAHRLDRDTSGLLLIAKRRPALQQLQKLQLAGRVEKRYLALVAGRWRRERVTADAPLRKNTLRSGERIVRVDPQGKTAVTHFSVRRRFADAMLVEARLETGRTHQIRVHAAHLGAPILGDTKYGDEEANRRFRERGLDRLFLHAWRLDFPWQGRREGYHLEAPLPEELQHLLDELR
ncbi:MAG: RluA family pseudouridine synthase [Gammaproteobacteria bacterium]|nr:MAG: RluA family pseudouridine synthase [Gammaproteobacteria bacterium]